MKIYFNAALQNTFTVSNEYHPVRQSKVTLNYMPIVDSITILGFTRSESNTPQAGEFYIDHVNNQYVLGTPDIYFNPADEGKHLNIDYRGVPLVAELKNTDEVRNAVRNLFKASNQTKGSGKAEIASLFERSRKKNTEQAYEDLQAITDDDIRALFS